MKIATLPVSLCDCDCHWDVYREHRIGVLEKQVEQLVADGDEWKRLEAVMTENFRASQALLARKEAEIETLKAHMALRASEESRP